MGKKKPKSVVVEISIEDDAEDVQGSFVKGIKELGLKIEEDWNGEQDSPTKFIISLPLQGGENG